MLKLTRQEFVDKLTKNLSVHVQTVINRGYNTIDKLQLLIEDNADYINQKVVIAGLKGARIGKANSNSMQFYTRKDTLSSWYYFNTGDMFYQVDSEMTDNDIIVVEKNNGEVKTYIIYAILEGK